MSNNRSYLNLESNEDDADLTIITNGNSINTLNNNNNNNNNSNIYQSNVNCKYLFYKIIYDKFIILYFVFISLFIILSIIISNRNNNIDQSLNKIIEINNDKCFKIDNLYLLNNDVDEDMINNQILLYGMTNNTMIFGRIPNNYVTSLSYASNSEFLLVEQITKGLGITDLYWDPGNIINQKLVLWKQINENQLQLISPQIKFRSSPYGSFSNSIIDTFDILGKDDKGLYINFNEFVYSKAGIKEQKDISDLIINKYGSQFVYEIDKNSSFLNLNGCKYNTKMTSLESQMTYSSSTAPYQSNSEAQLTKSFSVSLRRSFLLLSDLDSLQDNSYIPRQYHPKSGFNSISYKDELASVYSPYQYDIHYMVRYNIYNSDSSTSSKATLEIKDTIENYPQVKEGTLLYPHVKEGTLLYLIDPDTPEPMKTSLLKGVQYWDQAFNYAGFPIDTFKVAIADKSFDKFDLTMRNIGYVEWINRDRRSYSVGQRIIDPRTGQILRGHVRIENLRMKQDYFIINALFNTNFGNSSIMIDIINNRVMNLGAHEVGHTIGLSHNFAGSTSKGGIASVMDYPPPIITPINNEELVINNLSYTHGIGFFDKIAIDIGYRQYPSSTSQIEVFNNMKEILLNAEKNDGYAYLTDDAENIGNGDARSTKWDYGVDYIESFDLAIQVREIALNKLNATVLNINTPLSSLQELFPIIFLWHRYEVNSISKLIGGFSYQYSLSGDKESSVYISNYKQIQAIDCLLKALEPKFLYISPQLIKIMLPTAFGYEVSILGNDNDAFSTSNTGKAFNKIDAIENAVSIVLSAVFDSSRVNRIITQKSSNSSLPSLLDILNMFSTKVILFNNYSTVESIYYLESITTQQLLVNTYLSLYTSMYISAIAASQIKIHLALLTIKIDYMILNISSNCIELICNEFPNTEWLAHYYYLNDKIKQLKPFLNIISDITNGPPI